jgi:hypothetical protein
LKRRSGTSKSRPEEPLTYFVDRALGRRLVTELRAAGLTVEAHDDHFAQDTEDVDLFPVVGAHGWVFLTKDKAIKKRDNELTALLEAGLATFILSSGNLKAEEMAEAFTRAKARMERTVRKTSRPFIAKVHRDGSVEVVLEGERRRGEERG